MFLFSGIAGGNNIMLVKRNTVLLHHEKGSTFHMKAIKLFFLLTIITSRRIW